MRGGASRYASFASGGESAFWSPKLGAKILRRGLCGVCLDTIAVLRVEFPDRRSMPESQKSRKSRISTFSTVSTFLGVVGQAGTAVPGHDIFVVLVKKSEHDFFDFLYCTFLLF